MKKFFIAKQGFGLKLLSIILQNLIILPFSLLLSFLLASVITTLIDCSPLTMFKILIIILNVLWIIRNSAVKIYDDRIVYRSLIGTNRTIRFDDIVSFERLDAKSFRKIILNSSNINPLITNCFSVLFPPENVIMFKSKYDREIAFSVWDYKRLINLLGEKLQKTDLSESGESSQTEINDENSAVYRMFLRAPLKSYVILYIKHFVETIILPAAVTLLVKWLFGMAEISVNSFILVLVFLMQSLCYYLKIISVVIDNKRKIIKLNFFQDSSKRVIKYKNLKNLHYLTSADEFEKFSVDKPKRNIVTPFNMQHIEDVIAFETESGVYVMLSVSNHKKLNDCLRNSEAV